MIALACGRISSRIDGVVQVKNELLINGPATSKTDGEVLEEIQKQLWRNPIVYIGAAAISVQQGVATLMGVVESLKDLELASEKAYDAGAKRVRNYLQVSK